MPVDLDRIRIQPLTDLHTRGAFCCADRSIQNFCRGRLAAHNRSGMMRAYVACDEGSYDVLGFYYLLNTSVEHEQLGPGGGAGAFIDINRIPAVYLGMIAVDDASRRQGLGTQLMIHAFKRVIDLADISGVWAMTLDAINDEAVPFYERFDFKRFSPDGREMYLTVGTMRQAFGDDG